MEEVNNINNESILDSIKKLIGLTGDYTIFDNDIIMHINTVLSNLVQMGIGPAEGFVISNNSETWKDFIGDKYNLMQQIKTYVYMKVKMIFDPPTNATLLKAMEEQAKELEWRMYTEKGNY